MIKINKYQIVCLNLSLTLLFISCNSSSKWDGLVAIPTSILEINGKDKILNGIKNEYLNDCTLPYNKLTIPKSIQSITNFIYKDNFCILANIKKIDYEQNCLCQNFLSPTFANLPNLESIILPPKITNLEEQCIINCLNLKTIDITNLIEYDCLNRTNWISNISSLGTIICKESQKEYANKLIKNNKQYLENWIITIEK